MIQKTIQYLVTSSLVCAWFANFSWTRSYVFPLVLSIVILAIIESLNGYVSNSPKNGPASE